MIEEDNDTEEWTETHPVLTRKNTAVECSQCESITNLKYHMSREGFSYLCNKCRRKLALKKAQRKYNMKRQAIDAVKMSKMLSSLTGRLDSLLKTEETRVAKFVSKMTTGTFKPTDRQIRVHNTRRNIVEYYKGIRGEMLEDIVRGNPKPFLHYLNDDELQKKYLGDSYGEYARGSSEKEGNCTAEELWA